MSGVYSAEEEIEDPAEVVFGEVIGDAEFEVAVEGDGVEVKLEVVVMFAHFGFHGLWGIVIGRGAEVIGFPVEEIEAAIVLEDEIDEAFEEAFEGVEVEIFAEELFEISRGEVADGEMEIGFGEALGFGDLLEAKAGEEFGGEGLADGVGDGLEIGGGGEASDLELGFDEGVDLGVVGEVEFFEDGMEASACAGATWEGVDPGFIGVGVGGGFGGGGAIVIWEIGMGVGDEGGEATDAPVAGDGAGESAGLFGEISGWGWGPALEWVGDGGEIGGGKGGGVGVDEVGDLGAESGVVESWDCGGFGGFGNFGSFEVDDGGGWVSGWGVEDPIGGGDFGFIEATPDEIALEFGAGEGDVEESGIFGEEFLCEDGFVGLEFWGAEVEGEGILGVMKDDEGIFAGIGVGPGEGDPDEIKFEAFAFVDGDDFDGGFVTFEALFVGVGGFGLGIHLGGEPSGEASGAEVLGDGGFVEEFGEVEEIGEAAFAVEESEEARADLPSDEEATESGGEAVFEPIFLMFGEAIEDGFPFGEIGGEIVDGGGIVAEGDGGESGAEEVFAGGVTDGVEDGEELASFFGLEDAGAAHDDGREARGGEFGVEFFGFVVGFGEDGEIGRGEGATGDGGGGLELGDDGVGDGEIDLGGGFGFGEGFFVGAEPELEGWGGIEGVGVLAAGGGGVKEIDSWDDERGGTCFEEVVYGFDEWGDRALV